MTSKNECVVDAGILLFNDEDKGKAADIEALLHLVQTKVREQTAVALIHEVHIIGDS